MIKLKNILIFLISVFIVISVNIRLYGQDTLKSTTNFEVRVNSFYDFEVHRDDNFRTLQAAPVFSLHFKHHNFYLGPLYAYVFPLEPASDIVYNYDSYGINFGYRYYSPEVFKNGKIFGQCNFSIYRLKYKEYQQENTYAADREKTNAENTVALGLDLQLFKRFHFFFDFGFGSNEMFFLLLDKFTLASNAGIEYQFK